MAVGRGLGVHAVRSDQSLEFGGCARQIRRKFCYGVAQRDMMIEVSCQEKGKSSSHEVAASLQVAAGEVWWSEPSRAERERR